VLFLDGVYVQDSAGNFIFHYNKAVELHSNLIQDLQ
tara:strand:+ start:1356 stop:1463 length:108 start_codon:yes stop_codon:yes gene_type:complete